MLIKVQNQMQTYINEIDNSKILQIYNNISIGKMLRSKLILKIAKESEISIKLCAIVELIHLASLLHDDVIDESIIRRGKPSINASFGNKKSIMLGDILYSKAFFELTKFDSNIAQVISNAVTLLSIGEFLDVELAQKFNSNKDLYFDMIYKKTSALIEASAKASAILAGKNSNKFGLYGKNLGIAFQIVDDLLDITQTSEQLGKPAMSDFRDGKSTLPYILLYEKLDFDDKELLKSMFARELSEYEESWLKEKFTVANIKEESLNIAITLANDGIKALENEDANELIAIMRSMIDREF